MQIVTEKGSKTTDVQLLEQSSPCVCTHRGRFNALNWDNNVFTVRLWCKGRLLGFCVGDLGYDQGAVVSLTMASGDKEQYTGYFWALHAHTSSLVFCLISSSDALPIGREEKSNRCAFLLFSGMSLLLSARHYIIHWGKCVVWWKWGTTETGRATLLWFFSTGESPSADSLGDGATDKKSYRI